MNDRITESIDRLLIYAVKSRLIEREDISYYRNILLDLMQLDAPSRDEITCSEVADETATRILREMCDLAVEKGLIEDLGYARDLFATRLIGSLTPSPKNVREAFWKDYAVSPRQATDAFYRMCQKCDYVKVDAIAQNIRYFEKTPVGELEITINLSKPEKDPREIAKLKNAKSVGYPLCMLCKENPGYAGRSNFPARQNHRMIPIKLGGQDWYLQYSPYAYYSEHCIVLNHQHIPMRIERGSFERLFAFVEQFPHYFIGSNADLPIVGGSILNHDHFQGGQYTFPMDQAKTRVRLSDPVPGVSAEILDWPMSTLCLRGKDKDALIDLADRVLQAWRGWTDDACGILAYEEDGTPHNTITPILRRENDAWKLCLVLRNNRTSEEWPLGIFHPHTPLHHIKRENIGLIEVMGLFILPGRLKTELHLLEDYLTGEKPLTVPSEEDPSYKHFAWVKEIVEKQGLCRDHAEAERVLRRETAMVCAQVLRDCGVYPDTEEGTAGFLRFVRSLGMEKTE